VVDKYTGRIVLDKPRASLFAIALADVFRLHRLEEGDRGARSRAQHQAGRVGPLQVASFEKQRQVVCAATPSSRARPRASRGGGALHPGPEDRRTALRSGELDFAGLPPAIAEPLRSQTGIG
jgi:peptide/nickel transport system substrate-binding protein